MNNKPMKLSDMLTEKGVQTLLDGYTDFGADTALTDEQQQRILSSVMRKAGSEMKENMTEKKTRKHNRRFVGIIAAAALIGAGAVGTSAYYMADRGTWNAVKYKFEGSDSVLTEEQINEAAETIERITAPSGVCEKNTFDELDITYEGTVADQDDMEMMFTIRRKDGKSFEEKKNYTWMVKYSDAFYAYENEDTLYHTYGPCGHFKLNPDGSLSLALDGYIFYNNAHEDYDYRLGFIDLCYVPQDVCDWVDDDGEMDALAMDAWNAAHKLTGDGTIITLSDDEFVLSFLDTRLTGEEYDEAYADWQQKDAAYEKAVREEAEYYYSGELLYSVPAASLKNSVPTYTKEQTGSEFEVTISPQRITLKADGNFDEADESYRGTSEPFVKIDVHMKDASVKTLDFDSGRGGTYGIEEQEYFTFEFVPETPIKAEDIEYIQLADVKINING